MGCSARCRACGNSRLCRNVAELASLPFLPNEGACPKYTPSARIHCILERMLVSLTPKHPFSQFHPCQSVSEDSLFYEYDFSDKLGDIFSGIFGTVVFGKGIPANPSGPHRSKPEGPHPGKVQPSETEGPHRSKPEWTSSGRPRAVPGKVHPRAVETQVGPTATGRPRANSDKQTDHIRSHPVEPEQP